MPRLALAVALLVLGLPVASAAIAIEDVKLPERTAADRPFEVAISIANDGPARRVYLFGALYDAEEGKVCGSAADPRFRTFTHVLQEPVEVAANGVTRYPAEGARWLHRYGTEDASVAPETAELCLFVANATAGPAIEYEAFSSNALSVRAQNAPPSASFAWSPASPAAASDVTFTAEATDAEGDPVSFAWDFGHFDAGGRATGSGARVVESFFPAGEFVVTLTASDGIDEAPVTRTIRVAEAASTEEKGSLLPGPSVVAILACAITLTMLRRRR